MVVLYYLLILPQLLKPINQWRSKQTVKILQMVARILILSIFATIPFVGPIFIFAYAVLLAFIVIATWKGHYSGAIGILIICAFWLVILSANFVMSHNIRTYYLNDSVMIIGFVACIACLCGVILNIAIRRRQTVYKTLFPYSTDIA